MKTAEDWFKDFPAGGDAVEIIRAAQLDAWKQGMTDAAGEIVTDGNPDNARTRIITVRDSRTSL